MKTISRLLSLMTILAGCLSACGAVRNQTLVGAPVSEAPASLPPLEETRPAGLSPSKTHQPAASCQEDSLPDFSSYLTWTKVNPNPIDGHEVKVNIYVNDLARDTYIPASGNLFPECAAIVKTHLDDQDSVTAITVMVKMAKGFDPAHNDWFWGMYDSQGKNAMLSGKVQVCIDCHQPAAGKDYVFSEKVMAALAAGESQ